MEKYKAIPQGYMTVGGIAKMMNTTVRTLQYYDREGILSPSAVSEGGRRLYGHKDIIKLFQIHCLKYLGFSLEDIKTRLPAIDTPEEVSRVLVQQAEDIRTKINALQDVLDSLEKFNAEVKQMDTVDWEKYANIIIMLQAKNDGYWVMKYLSDNLINYIHNRMTKYEHDDRLTRYKHLIQSIRNAQSEGHAPESEPVQVLAKEWWEVVLDFTGGDMTLLPDLIRMGDKLDDGEWKDRFSFDKRFIKMALEYYFVSIGFDPNMEGAKQ